MDTDARYYRDITAATGYGIFGILIGYFVLHVVLRVILSDSVELDEAEELILTQEMRWGYGSQPPLYIWLQTLFFHIFGINIFALAITKNLILFLTYLFTYLSTKAITKDNRSALMAMVSLLLIPQIAWESQRTLAHSVMVTTMAAATLFTLIRLLQTGRVAYYALFGLCVGLGFLSKYNYVVFFLGLILAGLSVKRFRPGLLNKKSILGFGCSAIIVSPHVYWMVTHPGETLTQMDSLHLGEATSFLSGFFGVLGNLSVAIVKHFTLLTLIFLVLFYNARRVQAFDPEKRDYEALLWRAFAIALLLTMGVMLLFEVPSIKSRWLQPLLFLMPIYWMVLYRDRLCPDRFKKLLATTAAVGALVFILMTARTVLLPLTGHYVRLHAPFNSLAQELRVQGFHGGVIVGQTRWFSGGLKLFFEESTALAPEMAVFAAPVDIPWLIVWEPEENRAIPAELDRFVEDLRGEPWSAPMTQTVEAVYKYSRDKVMQLAFIIIEPSQD